MGSHSLGAVIDAEMPTHGKRGAGYAEAVGSPRHSPYFNTGVLVMDVPGWIENRVEERSLELVRDADIPLDYIDQDVMNAVFLNGWHALDTRWNVRSDLLDVDPFIVQFPSGTKPWEASASGPYVEEYRALASEVL
jgi:lipopolysaccharide biosynthesis glycosyltransferase